MEARFQSERFVTYRAYKFDFTSAPSEPPVLKAYAYGTGPDKSISVFYVSWNGATEVAAWNFYASGIGKDSPSRLLGTTVRTGFETTYQSYSYSDAVYAEAVSADGTVLGRTAVETAIKPSGWSETIAHSPQHDGDSQADNRWEKTEL
jgi:hypothetical protein